MGLGSIGTDNSIPGLLSLDTSSPEVARILQTGDVENDYDVEKDPIARGKFASVRLARDRSTKEVFAAKFVRRRRRVANLEQEARHEIAVLLLGRNTPHIVHLHHVYETRAEYIIILELGEGGDLQRILDEQGCLSEKSVKEILRQILKGLRFLHQNMIAHLDIKPQNLILMGSRLEDGVKLVDFGLSRVIHKDAELTQIMGTPDYVAPEVINFEPVGLATDMWSIGVLTYVLLTGYTPFGGENDQETFVNITQAEYDFPDEYFDGVSEQAKEFISILLVKSPNQRMSVDQTLVHAWLSDILDPHRLSQLSEADSADSGYSTDLCSSSPPSPETMPSAFPPDLCHFSIPEDQQMSNHANLQSSYHDLYQDRTINDDLNGLDRVTHQIERRPKISSARLSMDVIDCMRGLSNANRISNQVRGSSLVIPRYAAESTNGNGFNNQNLVMYDYGTPISNNAISQNCYYDSDVSDMSDNIPNFPSYSMTLGSRTKRNKRNNESADLNSNQLWTDGSHNRSTNLLKSPRKIKPKSNLGMRPELSYSMFELNPSCDNQRTAQSTIKPRSLKKDSRISSSTLRKDSRINPTNIESSYCSPTKSSSRRAQLNQSHMELRSQQTENRPLKIHDLRNCQSEIRLPHRNITSKLKESKTNSINSRKQLFASHNFSSIPCLNTSLSHLDIAHERQNEDDDDEDDDMAEVRDTVPRDCTLPRRFVRSHNSSSHSNMLSGNSFHMSFRRPKKREGKI